MATKWNHILVEVKNKGRIIFENGTLVKSHTKKGDFTALPKNLWNSKGKQMMHEAKGNILNHYGLSGWELVSTKFGEDNENTYIFKKK
jgi:hypothetical protein